MSLPPNHRFPRPRTARAAGADVEPGQVPGPRPLARILTLAGQALGREDLTVTVTETGPRDTDRTYATKAVCGGCRESHETGWNTYPWRSISDVHEEIPVRQAAEEAEAQARHWALAHAERCRELPVEDWPSGVRR